MAKRTAKSGRSGPIKNRKKPVDFAADAERQGRVVKFLGLGLSYNAAAGSAGVHRETVRRYRDANPNYAENCDIAYDEGTGVLEREAHRRATEGKSDTMLIFALKQRGWSDRQQVELAGKGAPITKIEWVIVDPASEEEESA